MDGVILPKNLPPGIGLVFEIPQCRRQEIEIIVFSSTDEGVGGSFDFTPLAPSVLRKEVLRRFTSERLASL
jgi:hypothetical protein